MICHDVESLHKIEPHIGPAETGNPVSVYGWAATGFHAGGGGDVSTEYQPFQTYDTCYGCHQNIVWLPEVSLKPAIKQGGITPSAACGGGLVTLYGEHFGDTQPEGVQVEMKVNDQWISMPIYAWSDTEIIFELPIYCTDQEIPTGNYRIRVGNSNQVGFTVKQCCCSPCRLTPERGPCNGAAITINHGNTSFDYAQDTILVNGPSDGIYRVVQTSSAQGEYIALSYTAWGYNSVTFRFKDFFQDLDGDFLQDANEPTMASCEGMDLGTRSVYVQFVSYSDDDGSGHYTQEDTITRVERTRAFYFELDDSPAIRKVKTEVGLRDGEAFKIIGFNFGLSETAGNVYIGKKSQYNPTSCRGKDCYGGLPTGGKLQAKVKGWEDGKIKVKAKFNQAKWGGKKRYIWVVKDGVVSNAKKVTIAAP
jgi:hypothetical protein